MSKHKIDTLILSGGGPSGVAYIGIFKALIENNILQSDFSGIQEIITTSVGIISSYLYMINIKQEVCQEVIMKFNILSVLNLDDIKIDNLLVDLGLFSTDKIGKIIQSITKNCLQCEDITLQELYDRIPIKLTVKVFNVTQKNTEYISYQTNPDLSIITLAQMTTAIPYFFKPVSYNDNLYVDGGLRGNFPIEACQSDNYLGIFIHGKLVNTNHEIFKLFPILEFTYSLMINKEKIDFDKYKEGKERILYIQINQGLNFDLSVEDKKNIIQKGYDNTLQHIQNYMDNTSNT